MIRGTNATPVKPLATAPNKPTAIQLIPKRLALGKSCVDFNRHKPYNDMRLTEIT